MVTVGNLSQTLEYKYFCQNYLRLLGYYLGYHGTPCIRLILLQLAIINSEQNMKNHF